MGMDAWEQAHSGDLRDVPEPDPRYTVNPYRETTPADRIKRLEQLLAESEANLSDYRMRCASLRHQLRECQRVNDGLVLDVDQLRRQLAETCPSCDRPRRLTPGSVCQVCGHVEPENDC